MKHVEIDNIQKLKDRINKHLKEGGDFEFTSLYKDVVDPATIFIKDDKIYMMGGPANGKQLERVSVSFLFNHINNNIYTFDECEYRNGIIYDDYRTTKGHFYKADIDHEKWLKKERLI